VVKIDGVPARIVAPLVAAFALFLAMLAASVRHRLATTKGRPHDTRRGPSPNLHADATIRDRRRTM
jgi:hypothetical protein